VPYFGALKIENDVYWSCMGTVMVTRMFFMLWNGSSVSAAIAVANVAAFWVSSAFLVYLTLCRPSLYLTVRTKILFAMRIHRAAILLAFVSLPAVQVIKWSRLLSEEPRWRYLVPMGFECLTLVAFCGWHLVGVWQAVAGAVIALVPAVRLLRRCYPLAAPAADATRLSMVTQLAAVAEHATSALLLLTLSHGAPTPTLAPCTQTNMALVLTFGFMMPILMCYAMEERIRLEFVAKRGPWVASPSRTTALAHAAAQLVLGGVIFWTGLSAIAPWATDSFDLY
jgi:hypothetical protein